jgi:hypothetical protein
LDEPTQGLFFVFLSLGVLFQLAEFGLTYSVLQISALLSSRRNDSDLRSLSASAHRVNGTLIGIAIIAVGLLGFALFINSSRNPLEPDIWLPPWLTYVAACAANQVSSLKIALLEGRRRAPDAWGIRFFQEAVAGLTLLVALLLGLGLWSPAAGAAVRATAGLALTRLVDRSEAGSKPVVGSSFDWYRRVWPFQWRIGLSAISGFLIFQAVNPIVLVTQGAELAGKVGVVVAIMNMLVSITSVWPLSQATHLGHLLETRQLQRAQRLFRSVLVRSTALSAFAATITWVLIYLARLLQLPLSERIASNGTVASFLVAAVAHHTMQCFAVTLRAEGREPLLAASVVGGVVNLLAVWLTARFGEPLHIGLAVMACAIAGLPIGIVLYRGQVKRLSS